MIELLYWIIVDLILIALLLSPIVLIIVIIRNILKKKTNRQGKSGFNNYPDNQFKTDWIWVENRQLWVRKDQYSAMEDRELAKQIHISRNGPTYEEWKAQNNSTYHYSKTEIPKQEQPQTKQFRYAGATYQYKPEPEPDREPKKTYQQPQNTTESDYQGAYKAAAILTPNESYHFKTLKAAADQKGYTISVKMRLADLVTPNAAKHTREYMSRFGKIKAKHVDFVVCDQMMRPVVIIELDDSSHDRPDRQDRDDFVDTILKDAGYKIIHTRHITPDILDNY